jgi:hypothetical protein
MKILMTLALLALVPAAWAQQDTLWKVDNALSPTVVPLYAKLPSPFPPRKSQPKPVAVVMPAATAEAEALARAKAAADREGRRIIASPGGVEPDLGNFAFAGTLNGPAGRHVLWRGRWLGLGDKVPVAARPSQAARSILARLDEIDPPEGDALRRQLAERLRRQPTLPLTVMAITSDSAVIGNDLVKYRLRIRQPAF